MYAIQVINYNNSAMYIILGNEHDHEPFNLFSGSISNESSSDDFEGICTERTSGRTECVAYNGDVLTPVFEWQKQAYQFESLVKILLGEHAPERLCVSQPVNIAHNVSFLVNNARIKNLDDLKCDDMGAWEHNGSPKKSFLVKRDKHGMVKNVTLLQENESPEENSDVFTLKRIYYVNKSSSDLRKVISTVQGKYKASTKVLRH